MNFVFLWKFAEILSVKINIVRRDRNVMGNPSLIPRLSPRTTTVVVVVRGESLGTRLGKSSVTYSHVLLY